MKNRINFNKLSIADIFGKCKKKYGLNMTESQILKELIPSKFPNPQGLLG